MKNNHNNLITLKTAACSLLVLRLATATTLGQSDLILDDFDGPDLDKTTWGVGFWELGDRTVLGSDPLFGEENGITFITLTLSDYHPNYPGTKFLGTEIYSLEEFARGQGIEFEARVRVRTEAPGLINSFFTYGQRGDWPNAYSDELDFEYLTNWDPNRILTTTWNNWFSTSESYNDGTHHSGADFSINSLNRNEWNTLTIRWLPDHSEWHLNYDPYVDPSASLIHSTSEALPDDPMSVRANSWAASTGWTDAFSSELMPVSEPSQKTVYYYDIDYVRVTALSDDIPSDIPTAPSNLTAKVVDSIVTLNWDDNSENETVFEIYRAAKPKGRKTPDYNQIDQNDPNMTEYTDAPGDGTWLYQLTASNESGASEPTPAVEVSIGSTKIRGKR